MKILMLAEVSDHVKALEQLGEVVYAGWYLEQKIMSEAEMIELMQTENPDILVTSYDPVTKDVIDAATNLKMIVCTRSTPVNINSTYAHQKNILVSYSPERNADCTAEFTVALMLSVMRNIPQAYVALKSGKHTAKVEKKEDTTAGLKRDVTWSLGGDTPYILYKGFQLKGKTLGVVGYGSIGKRVANIARGFGMKIATYTVHPDPEKYPDVFFADSLIDLAKISDVLTVHAKDTPETYHMINAEVFDAMKETGYFINTSRGILVDEAALIEALRAKKIAGAGIDVYDKEPIVENHPFITELDNIVITPHLGGATWDAIDFHTHQLVEDIELFLKGKPLKYKYILER